MTTTYPQRTHKEAAHRPISRPLAAALASVLLAALFLYSGWTYSQRLFTVTIAAEGVTRTVRTAERDPAALLAGLGLPSDQGHRVTLTQGELRQGSHISIDLAQPVLLLADGRRLALGTHSDTVGQVLAEAGITVGWRDQILLDGVIVGPDALLPAAQWQQPAPGLPRMPWEREAAAVEISLRRALPVTVIDGGAAPAVIYTTAATIAAALEAEAVPIYLGDSVFPPPNNRVLPGQRIVIQRSTPIEISVEGATIATRTRQQTVGDALAEHNISVLGLDRVTPALSAPLEAHTRIEITRVREDVEYGQRPLPFETVWQPDPDVMIDERRVTSAGGEGLLRWRYRVRYEDGVEVSRELEDEWVAIEPQTRVISYGTRIAPRTLQTADGEITYWRMVRMYANSYSPRRSGTPITAPWYGRTRLGMQLQKGIIAVDPSVVNMQQRLYVPGYGFGIAGDTGGGVQGKHIDLGYSDDDYVSWHWWTDVYFLWPPPPAYSIRYVLPNWPQYPDRGR